MVATRAVCDVLDEFRHAVDALVGVDASVLADGEAVVTLLRELSRVEAVVCRQTAAFDASREWAMDEAPNSTVWVTTSARVTRRQSRRRLSIGRALRAMPLVEAAFLAGVLTAEHVEALADARGQSVRAAAAVTGAESELVAWATELAFHRLVNELKQWLNEVDPEGSEKGADKVRDGRRVCLSQSFEGKWFLDGVLDPVAGEIVNGVLSRIEVAMLRDDLAAVEKVGADARWGDLVRTAEQRRCDAFVEMAARAEIAPKDGRRPAPLFTVLVGEATFERTCEMASGTVLTPGSVAPYLTDAVIERVVFDGPDRVMSVGRQRTFTGAVRRAVQVRDRHCTHPFCDRSVADCEVDHIVPWATGGPTSERNGRLRCSFHNRLGTAIPEHKRTRRSRSIANDEKPLWFFQPAQTTTHRSRSRARVDPFRARVCDPSAGVRSMSDNNKQIVQQYWDALASRDWDAMKALLTDDAHYTDVGTVGPGGTGPDGVINRLRIGLEPLAGYEHLNGTNMIAEGDLVMTEHTERWTFHTGEVIDHSFVSVTQLRDGLICRWHDYSNIPNITDNAPRWWIEHIIKASTES